MPPIYTPQFDEVKEKEIADAARAIAVVIAHLGFYTKDDQRIEIDMPLPLPLARHWAERGMRIHPKLAAVKPAKSDQGEDIWVPLTADDPAPEQVDGEIDPEQLGQLKDLVSVLLERIEQAESLGGAPR